MYDCENSFLFFSFSSSPLFSLVFIVLKNFVISFFVRDDYDINEQIINKEKLFYHLNFDRLVKLGVIES